MLALAQCELSFVCVCFLDVTINCKFLVSTGAQGPGRVLSRATLNRVRKNRPEWLADQTQTQIALALTYRGTKFVVESRVLSSHQETTEWS
jgi:hypothetical protein